MQRFTTNKKQCNMELNRFIEQLEIISSTITFAVLMYFFCSNWSSIIGHIYLNTYHCLYFECRCNRKTHKHKDWQTLKHSQESPNGQQNMRMTWKLSLFVNFLEIKSALEKLLEVRCTSKSLNPHQHQQSLSVANSAALQLHWAALRCKLYECAVGRWRREADMQTDGKSPILTSECAFSSVCKEEA